MLSEAVCGAGQSLNRIVLFAAQQEPEPLEEPPAFKIGGPDRRSCATSAPPLTNARHRERLVAALTHPKGVMRRHRGPDPAGSNGCAVEPGHGINTPAWTGPRVAFHVIERQRHRRAKAPTAACPPALRVSVSGRRECIRRLILSAFPGKGLRRGHCWPQSQGVLQTQPW